MSKKFTRRISIAVVLVFLVSLLANNAVSAVTVTTAPSAPFKDLNPTYWAVKDIIKMYARGVTSGYKDGTFLSNNPVTQLEAVLMAVKNMAVPSHQIAAMDASQPLPFSVPAWAETGNKKELLFAVQKGLVVPAEKNFTASAKATRAWVAQLMVRMINKDDDASGLASQQPSVKDAADIPHWAVGYINAAYKYKLISGYPDNSFKPNQNVTRAEMVTLLSKGEQYLGMGDGYKVLNVSGQNISVAVNNVAKMYTLTPNTWVFDAGGRYSTTGNIQKDDVVKIIISGTTVRYIEILPVNTVHTTLKGTVLQVIAKDKVIVVKDENQVIHTKSLTAGAAVSSQNGDVNDLTQVASGSQVELSLNTAGSVVAVKVLDSGTAATSLGIIYQINQGQKLIILKNSAGKLNTYEFSDQVTVKIAQLRFPTIKDLQAGDEVKITVAANLVTEVELVQAQKEAIFSGKIMVLSTEKRIVTIQTADGVLKAFPVSDTAQITIASTAAAQLASIQVNDNVELTVEKGIVTAIKVNDRNVQTVVTGIVAATDTTNRIITLKVDAGVLKAYELSSNAQFAINDSTTSNFYNVKKDMKVEVQLVDNKVIYLELKNTVKGTVVSLDQNRRLITLDYGSTSQTYVLDSSVDVDIDGDSSAGISNINKNDFVEIRVENDFVTKVNVRKTYTYEVTDVFTGTSELRVKESDGDRRYLSLNSRVTVTVQGVEHPGVSDIAAGDVVKATFLGTRLDSVEVAVVSRGRVISINNYNNTVTIQLFDGTTKNYSFDTKCEVVNGSQKNYIINALLNGDRVEIREKTDGGLTFTVMTKVSTKFQSYTDDGNKVYVANDPITWRNYVVSGKLYVHRGTESLAVRNLAKDDPIDLFLLNDMVYEIEKK